MPIRKRLTHEATVRQSTRTTCATFLKGGANGRRTQKINNLKCWCIDSFFFFVLFFLLLFVNVDDLTAAINGSVSFCFARVLFVCVSSPDVEKFGAATRLSKPHQKRKKKIIPEFSFAHT